MLDPHERQWWTRPEDALEDEDPLAHDKLRAVMSTLEREQSYRKRSHLMHAAMYGNNNVLEYDTRTRPGVGSTLTLNISRSLVNAVVSRVASKNDPHLSYVTDGGDYEKQHNAEQLERGVDGVFYQSKLYAKSRLVFRDSATMGIGFARVWPNEDKRRVQVDRWLPWNVILDDGESLYRDGQWRSFYTTRYETAAHSHTSIAKRRRRPGTSVGSTIPMTMTRSSEGSRRHCASACSRPGIARAAGRRTTAGMSLP